MSLKERPSRAKRETAEAIGFSNEEKIEVSMPVEYVEEEVVDNQGQGILSYKQVPTENKTKRKNIVLYPSLDKEIQKIIKKQGISFNDLVNTLLLEYAEKHKI